VFDQRRAPAERGEAPEALPAEHHHAGADRLLHPHGGVLHEGVGEQGTFDDMDEYSFKM